jgi:chromosome segregation ATPase
MMAKTTEEKIAELSVLVNDLKQKFPLMEHSISEISNTLTREQMNIGMLTKQYDKLYEIVEDFKEIQYSVQKLNDDSKRFAEQIDKIKTNVEEVITKERNCEILHQLQEKKDKEQPKTVWTFEKVISIAPNVIAVISFIGYLCYLVFVDKMKTGGL